MDLEAKTAEIDRNLARFIDLLPALRETHLGEYVLMRCGDILSFHESALDAQIKGNLTFADRLFSIQLVQNAAEELGYMSYAIPSG